MGRQDRDVPRSLLCTCIPEAHQPKADTISLFKPWVARHGTNIGKSRSRHFIDIFTNQGWTSHESFLWCQANSALDRLTVQRLIWLIKKLPYQWSLNIALLFSIDNAVGELPITIIWSVWYTGQLRKQWFQAMIRMHLITTQISSAT